MCDFQSWYTVFGSAGSMWVNVLITAELYRASSCARRCVPYAPPSVRAVYARLAVTYTLVAAFSWLPAFGYRVWPDLPLRSSAVRGLNCLPVPYDAQSQVVFLAVVFGVVALAPASIVLAIATAIFWPGVCSMRTGASGGRWRAARAPVQDLAWGARQSTSAQGAGGPGACAAHTGGHMRPPSVERSESRAPTRGRMRSSGAGRMRSSSAGRSKSPDVKHLREAVAAPAGVDERTFNGLAVFFARLFLVMIVCWAPFFVSWVVQLPYDKTSAYLTWATGTWAHVQGVVSAVLYSLKEDVHAEWRLVAAEVGQIVSRLWRACGRPPRREPRPSAGARAATDSAQGARCLLYTYPSPRD